MARSLPVILLTAVVSSCLAQQTVFLEDFEAAQSAFTLNAPDMGSVQAGDNTWLVNNAYSGGQGTLNCFGIPFSFTIPATVAQPAGISSPNGNYLHITSEAAISSGILNCNFAAADGICTAAASHFVRMANDVSTVGAVDATLSFWWLCAGSPSNYGELYYSTDGGTSWILVPPPGGAYRDQATWTQQTVTLPDFAGQASLRFGFRFVNNETTAASDPAFGIDDVMITTTAETVSLSTGALSSAAYCPGSTLIVPYTATGTWDTGNIFTAQLSDANGSFGAPTDIGSITSNSSGTITAVIPVGTPVGAGYLIRVVGSAPAIVAANTQAISLTEAPFAGLGHHVSFCSNAGPQVLLDEFPGASSCGSWTGPDGNAMSGVLYPETAPAGGYTYTTNCPGDCPQDMAVLVVGIVQAPNAGDSSSITVCTNDPAFVLFPELGGTPQTGGTWSYLGAPHPPIFNPGVDSEGCYEYTVAGVSPCANATAMVCVEVDDCTGIHEDGAPWPELRWLGQAGQWQQFRTGPQKPDQVIVYDAVGHLIPMKFQVQGQLLLLDLAGASPGAYAARLINGSRAGVVRFIQQR
jgi:hypothetical protein